MDEDHDSQIIGHYRTLRELGRGGQAIVWLAEDTRIQRQVALKVLHGLGPGGEEALRRFRSEAEVASRLEHPGICAVLEADLERGTPYIAMRYVPGETLAKRLAAARAADAPPPDRAGLRELARIFELAARALHVAHEAGVTHRDIKPANVMITPAGEPVILDFGLARHDDASSQLLTITGQASGTPAYMSPEQMSGRARPDQRTDVWSLGIALSECATLRHPFEAATREGLFHAVLSEEPSHPRRVNPSIDRDLATILATATAKDRDRRYQSAADLAEDLRRWIAMEPIRARPVGLVERTRRWTQRNPLLAAGAAAIVLLLLGSIALLSYGLGASDRAGTEAGLRVVAETERAAAEAARRELEQMQADRRFAEELDELTMQMGTLWYGLQEREGAVALLPRYVAVLQRFGIDLTQPGSVAPALSALAGLERRNPDLWAGVSSCLANLEWLAGDEHASLREPARSQAMELAARLPGANWPELEAAVRRWEVEGVDEFDAFLSEATLERRNTDQLAGLASSLMTTGTRLPDALRVLERAIRNDPGSFQLHFLAGAFGFMDASEARNDPDEFRRRSAKVVHHMQVAVALRPRSGFVRAMLANAFAMSGDYAESARCIEQSTELEPDNALVWLFKARYYSYTPDPRPGIEACKKALELDPDIRGARELLAQMEARSHE